ncbi:MAG: class I SAM-dependent methyltransferase [Verrucomicrobia bacterium]|nr:class I SAM-dependent methyltransferase [Verrucomicrobiota bacterium]
MQPAFWDARYANEDGYVFGTAPNDFLRTVADTLKSGGRILCLAEGEGRNAVFLAERGHAVTAVDHSAVGLAKARRLADERGVLRRVNLVVADLRRHDLRKEAWDAIVWIFLHLPPPDRLGLLQRATEALAPGGLLVLECYTPRQVRWKTGGPIQAPELLMELADLQRGSPALETLIGRECERDVIEGSGHTGRADVVQWLARKPLAVGAG